MPIAREKSGRCREGSTEQLSDDVFGVTGGREVEPVRGDPHVAAQHVRLACRSSRVSERLGALAARLLARLCTGESVIAHGLNQDRHLRGRGDRDVRRQPEVRGNTPLATQSRRTRVEHLEPLDNLGRSHRDAGIVQRRVLAIELLEHGRRVDILAVSRKSHRSLRGLR